MNFNPAKISCRAALRDIAAIGMGEDIGRENRVVQIG